MPIQPPDLDDLRYERVTDLLVSRIPVHAPEWTDHNESDPGIAILQLFAWLADQVGYRLNQVPDRNYLAFLDLLGIQLRPAEPASTRLAFFMTKPETVPGRFAIPAGSTVRASADGNPTFETDVEIDAVPAQLGALVTTVATDLRKLSADESPDPDADAEAWLDERFALVWDGVSPKLHLMPTQPAAVGQVHNDATHEHLWLGLVFNPAPTAGFRGQRVTMTVQLDDDEQPDTLATVTCAGDDPEDAPDDATYLWYRPRGPGQSEGGWVPLRVISDTTLGWTRSGEVRFDVPDRLGPIPDEEWEAVRTVPPMTLQEICDAAEGGAGDDTRPEPVDHPLLDGDISTPVTGLSLVVPISGWIGVSFSRGNVPPVSIRSVCFNVAPATAAATVRNELIGTGDGRPGQTGTLSRPNVLASSLEVGVEDPTDGLLHDWTQVDTLDGAGPADRVYLFDPEAGKLTFGDGNRGQPPSLGARIVAYRFRHVSGPAVDLSPGTITTPLAVPGQVSAATNVVSALGAKPAETLEEAKARAPMSLKVLERAVTNSDYQFLALQTPGLDLGRAEVVSLRRPFTGGSAPGLDMATEAPGALSVIVVPDEPGLYPRPTAGMMRTVCRWLDGHRLVTTEVHIVPPMYVRLYDLDITVVAEPGYSTALLRETLAADLERWLHVLTGGDDGQGWVFGSVLPHSALVARLFSIPGVKRVEGLECWFDGRAPAEEGETGGQIGRDDRLVPGLLTGCPDGAGQVDRILLQPDEVVFVDTTTMNLEVRR